MLQEHPHLFCNGKFKIDHPNWGGAFTLDHEFMYVWIEQENVGLDRATLIARPIEDMSDEEIYSYESKKRYRIIADDWADTFESKLYLLSIGVYPFDQSHFEDGTVIDSRDV